MKKFFLLIVLVVFLAALTMPLTTTQAAVSAVTQTYSADFGTAFANPERGYHNRYEIINDPSVNDYASSATSIAGFNPDMLDRTFTRAKNLGNTLIHSYIHLDKFKNTDTLPQALLDNLDSGLDAIRAAGMKIVVRPAYEWAGSPSVPESRILGHIGQINSVISANADVVLHLESGYLGPWGEWHTSLYTDPFNREYADVRYRIIKRLLTTTPAHIPVLIRYPIIIKEMMEMPAPAGTVPFTQQEKDRIAFHNDCFLADSADMGTYDNNSWMGWFYIEEKKQWMYDLITSFGTNKMRGGETCDSAGYNDAAAVNVQAEMSKLNFTEINEDFAAVNTNLWKNANLAASGVDPAETAFVRIKRKLGYRIRLIDATFPASATAGGNFTFSANLSNDGYSGIVKPRPIFLVFQNGSTRVDVPLNGVDVRTWLSGANSISPQTVTLPSNIPSGTYRLALWLPDQATGLRSRPEYSVRFANQGMWDAAAGYNVLSNAVNVGGGCTTNCPTNPPPPTNTRTNTPAPVTPSNTPVPPTTAPPTRTNTPVPPTVTPESGSYEAEAPANTLAGGALIANCAACSGGRKVGYVGNNLGTLQFNGIAASAAGSYTLTIFYTSGEARSARISVNGGAATTLNFASSGSWDTVGSINTTVTLNAGNNTIRFDNPSGWAVDFDRIRLNTGVTATNTPTRTPTRTNTPGVPTNTTVGPTRTRTNTPSVPTNTSVPPTATAGGAPLNIDTFSNATVWSNKLNDLNQSLSWVMDNAYYGSNPPGEIILNSGGLNQYYQETINQSLSGRTTLVLRLRDWNSGSGSEQHWNIVLNDGTDHSVALSSYGTITGSYQNFTIPLSAFNANLAAAKYIRIVHKNTTYAVLIIDSIVVN